MENKGILKNLWDLTDAVKVLLLTALSYATAYCYEIGYLNGFNIDYSVAEVTIPVLISGTIISIFGLFMFYALIWGVWSISVAMNKTWLGKAGRLYLTLSFLLLVMLLITSAVQGTVFFLMVAPIVGFLGFILILLDLLLITNVIVRRNLRMGWRDTKEFLERDTDSRSDNNTLLPKTIAALVAISAIFTLSFFLGKQTANASTDFNLTESDGTCYVVVRKYNDTLLLKPYDFGLDTFDNSLRIYKANGAINLHKMKITEALDC